MDKIIENPQIGKIIESTGWKITLGSQNLVCTF